MSVAPEYDAVIVGAGPNGLTAAARLAREGRRVVVFEAAPTPGGGSRTAPFAHESIIDVCATVHPFGASSPAFEALGLADHGLRWLQPDVLLANPFDDGTAAVLLRDIDATADRLGADGARWRRLIGTYSADWNRLRHLVLGSVIDGTWHHPLRMAKFGSVAGLPASVVARAFREREAKAMVGGFAAHSGVSFAAPTTGGFALAMLAAAHAVGMPFAAGGSRSVVDALCAVIAANGGEIVCGHHVARLDDLPSTRATLLDVTPTQFDSMAPRPSMRRSRRWRHGVAAWKLDLLMSEPMPWTAPDCRAAGTIHLGGEIDAMATAERRTFRGQVPDLPYMIVAQPSTADPSRAQGGQHVVWAYRHVPNGCTDAGATTGIERQFDRFAPGWRDVVVESRVTTATDYAVYNESYVGGDIAGGAMTPWQVVARPRLAIDPYRTPIDGVWMCSQSTPPGPGVHGMCGWHAAGSVLRAT